MLQKQGAIALDVLACVGGLDFSLPDFLQDSYFCESAASSISTAAFFEADPLWDGQDCEGQCCTGSFVTVPTFCTTIEEVEDSTIRVNINFALMNLLQVLGDLCSVVAS